MRRPFRLACAVFIVLFLSACDTGSGSSEDPITNVDFENSSDLDVFNRSVGARVDLPTTMYSTFEIDAAQARGGSGSLKLSASADTSHYYYFGLPLETSFSTVTVDYAARGAGLTLDSGQYDNCYIGFLYRQNADDSYVFEVDSFDGTFDWTTGSLTISTPSEPLETFELGIFLSKTGDFWIDDIEITYQ